MTSRDEVKAVERGAQRVTSGQLGREMHVTRIYARSRDTTLGVHLVAISRTQHGRMGSKVVSISIHQMILAFVELSTTQPMICSHFYA